MNKIVVICDNCQKEIANNALFVEISSGASKFILDFCNTTCQEIWVNEHKGNRN